MILLRIDIQDFELAYTIRAFEEKLLELFSQGKLNGTVHTCSGQEFSSVALRAALQPGDWVVSNHRGHGHFLAATGKVEGLLHEIMGKTTGVCGGIGGSQHLYAENFISNGVQGGMTPVAAGLAFAKKLDEKSNVVFVYIGDGTIGQGILYESLNLYSLWSLPVILIVENNGYAQSTDTSTTIAGTIEGRARAFGIEYRKANTWEAEDLKSVFIESRDYAVTRMRPVFIEIQTYRLNAHSKGDDLRKKEEILLFQEKDTLNKLLKQPTALQKEVMERVNAKIADAIASAEKAPYCQYQVNTGNIRQEPQWSVLTENKNEQKTRIVDMIHFGLKSSAEQDRACFIGEDIKYPYNGAFNVTRNLSELFPSQVFSTPISEGAIVGVATGLALSGRRVFAEIMFGDFITLCIDQLVQHAGKFTEMFNNDLFLPLVVRTPMGGRRGYGPTHSQSIERLLLGANGISAIALNQRIEIGFVFSNYICKSRKPLVVIENKILYTRYFDQDRIPDFEYYFDENSGHTLKISPKNCQPRATVVVYGGMLEFAEAAAVKLLNECEIPIEIIVPLFIKPIYILPIVESVKATSAVFIFEEGPSISSFGAEVIALLSNEGCHPIIAQKRGYDGIIPSSLQREKELLIDAEDISITIREAFGK